MFTIYCSSSSSDEEEQEEQEEESLHIKHKLIKDPLITTSHITTIIHLQVNKLLTLSKEEVTEELKLHHQDAGWRREDFSG